VSSIEKRESFYEDGKVRTIEHYCEGRLHGEVILFWPSGVMKRRCYFEKGMRRGLDQMWDETGKLLEEALYE
jgi:antitoxin component YwqK of YwqJK toxin-antitoxin module